VAVTAHPFSVTEPAVRRTRQVRRHLSLHLLASPAADRSRLSRIGARPAARRDDGQRSLTPDDEEPAGRSLYAVLKQRHSSGESRACPRGPDAGAIKRSVRWSCRIFDLIWVLSVKSAGRREQPSQREPTLVGPACWPARRQGWWCGGGSGSGSVAVRDSSALGFTYVSLRRSVCSSSRRSARSPGPHFWYHPPPDRCAAAEANRAVSMRSRHRYGSAGELNVDNNWAVVASP
jgi:hypothetical protein